MRPGLGSWLERGAQSKQPGGELELLQCCRGQAAAVLSVPQRLVTCVGPLVHLFGVACRECAYRASSQQHSNASSC